MDLCTTRAINVVHLSTRGLTNFLLLKTLNITYMKGLYKFLPKENLFLLYAHYFLMLLFCPFIISYLCFFAGLSISDYYFPAALLFSSYMFIIQIKQFFSLRTSFKQLLFANILLLVAFILYSKYSRHIIRWALVPPVGNH